MRMYIITFDLEVDRLIDVGIRDAFGVLSSPGFLKIKLKKD